MHAPHAKKTTASKHETRTGRARPERPAMGMEAEFTLSVDGRPTTPEELFGDPRAFLRGPLMHRVGTSYHLPTGGAVYFDTGVIEVATPVIEIERGAPARAGRSLWESIHTLRHELDAWEARTGRSVGLAGFSAHYSVSFAGGGAGRVEALARLLADVLPVPVMMLAANRRSTGIGVRPRGDRIEITADFTPSASLMIATGTLIGAVARAVMAWPSWDRAALERAGVPLLAGVHPVPHTTRKGWLVNVGCFPRNPFQADVDAPLWETTDGRRLSLRAIAGLTVKAFWGPIRRLSDPFTFRLIGSVMRGRAPSLLELDDRPPAYDDVGRLCAWDDLFPERELSRSRYERVLIRAISGRALWMRGRRYTPTGMRGWSEVVFRRDDDGTRHVFGIDYLLGHLDDWERAPAA